MMNRIPRILALLCAVLLLLLTGTALAELPAESISLDYITDTAAVGQVLKPHLSTIPKKADDPLSWAVSDPGILQVDDRGYVTALAEGTATVFVSTGSKQASVRLTVVKVDDLLGFTKNDKGGYTIKSCRPDLKLVNIPAVYDGLPVNFMTGKAFLECSKLEAFTTDKDQATYYAVDGVLFTDQPEKTLVRYPNNKRRGTGGAAAYAVPNGTAAIGNYAFAGMMKTAVLHLPSSVTSIGKAAFLGVNAPHVRVYATKELKKINSDLFLGPKTDVVFYAPKGSYVLDYAARRGLGFDYLKTRKPEKKTVTEGKPDTKNAKNVPAVSGKIVTLEHPSRRNDPTLAVCISDEVSGTPGEFRLDLPYAWQKFMPDLGGDTASGYPAMQGVFGCGYTSGAAILRGYDADGRQIAVRRVKGNFVLSMPGAVELGVSGCFDTDLALTAYKPIFIAKPGRLPLDKSLFITNHEKQSICPIVLMFPSGAVSGNQGKAMSFVRSAMTYPGDLMDNSRYTLVTLSHEDPVLAKKLDTVTMTFDGMRELLDNDLLHIEARTDYRVKSGFAARVKAVLTQVRKTMIGRHYPKDQPINKISVLLSGEYMPSNNSVLNLDSFALDVYVNINTYTEEMVHAVDQSIVPYYLPAIWMDGRANFISREVCKAMRKPHGSYGLSWRSSMTEAEKADFYSFWYNGCTYDLETPVGYFFYRYLFETYGTDACMQIISNMAALPQDKPDDAKERFRRCITDATSDTVFQDFIRDVVDNESYQ